MNLDFISEALKDVCNVEIVEYDGYERAAITAKGFEEVIEVHYFPDGYYKYTVNFASWHMETSSREDLLDSVLAFVDGEYAAI